MRLYKPDEQTHHCDVQKNHGSAGVDHMPVTKLSELLEIDKEELTAKGNNIYRFLKWKLKLPINREKSGIRRPVHLTVLGFGFVPTYRKGERGKYQLVVSKKGWEKLKQKLKTITRVTFSCNTSKTTIPN